ncbi:MAG: ion channel [Pseudomonadota bacterium]
MALSAQIAIGLGWTGLAIAIAALFIVILSEYLDFIVSFFIRLPDGARNMIVLTLSALWLMLGIIAITFLWTGLFAMLDVFDSVEAGFYFTLICLTTVGFGDVILPDEWRVLAGFLAADGFIIFGLDTALLFEVLRRLRDAEIKNRIAKGR